MSHKDGSHTSINQKVIKIIQEIEIKYQKLFLLALRVTDTTVDEINDLAKEFFKQNSFLNAQIFLNSIFEKENLDISVSSVLTSALLNGSIPWKDCLNPSGLDSSIISSDNIIKLNTSKDGLVFDYSTKHDISAALIEKLTKTQVIYQKDIIEVIERLKVFGALTCLFFGKLSYLGQGVKKLKNL